MRVQSPLCDFHVFQGYKGSAKVWRWSCLCGLDVIFVGVSVLAALVCDLKCSNLLFGVSAELKALS